MKMLSKSGTVAILQPQFVKPETQIKGGLALISQRSETTAVGLVMDCKIGDVTLVAGKDKVILHGTAGLTAWARKIFCLNGKEYVICPESEIIGYILGDTA